MKARMPSGFGRPDMNALLRQAQKMQDDMKAKQLASRMLAAVLCASLLTSCMSAGETPEDISKLPSSVSSEPAVYSQPEESGEPVADGPLNPLTGESGFPESAVGKRPVTVMVNNIGDALPQRGLAAADMIY